jgi:hypothetical protein
VTRTHGSKPCSLHAQTATNSLSLCLAPHPASAAAAAIICAVPSSPPCSQPSDPKQSALWYNHLADPEVQGCGHVRLML